MSLFNPDFADPNSICINTSEKQVSRTQFTQNITKLADALRKLNVKTICIDLENSYAWCLIDIACIQAEIVCVPVPQFFTPAQTVHLLQEVNADVVFTQKHIREFENELSSAQIKDVNHAGCLLKGVNAFKFQGKFAQTTQMPLDTQKVTFTSGSTGHPKGVCLSTNNQLIVARSLADKINISAPKHLVILPLATLLENIAGVYAPLIAGGEVIVPSDKEKGFSGSKLVNHHAFLRCISQHEPETMIIVPELLQVLIMSSLQGWQAPSSFKFIAVGGAKVAADLMHQARALGLPVFQGYGLSECASVVSLNTDINSPADSVGEPLAHLTVSIRNNELQVSGNAFLGYVNQADSWYPEIVETGDIAKLDNKFLYIEGRSKNLIINSFGRNISPEWIESELVATGFFNQAVVIGDGQPFLCALVRCTGDCLKEKQISAILDTLNTALPDYAQVQQIIIMDEALSTENHMLGETGKIKRDAVCARYQTQITHIYQQAASQSYAFEKASLQQEKLNELI